MKMLKWLLLTVTFLQLCLASAVMTAVQTRQPASSYMLAFMLGTSIATFTVNLVVFVTTAEDGR